MTTPGIFLNSVVRVALNRMGLPSVAAERILMGTAAHESHFVYTQQLGGGPALGYFQMEPKTHDDCWNNYLKYRPMLIRGVEACMVPAVKHTAELMRTNSIYAAAMARVRYMRAPGPIPLDGLGMARYWKDNYNTVLGRGTVQEFINDWNHYLSGIYSKI